MTKLRGVSVVALCASLCGLTGCFRSTKLVQKTMAPDVYRSAPVEVLEKQVSDRDASIKTLVANVLITASTGGGTTGKVTTYTSFRGYIFVRRPGDLRVIMQLPVVGSRALDMVSDGKTFTLLIPPRNKAVIGSNAVTNPSKNGLENLRPGVFLDSLLVPGVAANQYVNLTESTRIMKSPDKKRTDIAEPDYDMTIAKIKNGNVLQTTRVVHISRVTMLPFEQDIYDDHGRVVTEATYDNYKEFSGVQFPTLIVMKRPLDEYELKVEVTKLTLNDELEDDQFELKIPDGITVQKMP